MSELAKERCHFIKNILVTEAIMETEDRIRNLASIDDITDKMKTTITIQILAENCFVDMKRIMMKIKIEQDDRGYYVSALYTKSNDCQLITDCVIDIFLKRDGKKIATNSKLAAELMMVAAYDYLVSLGCQVEITAGSSSASIGVGAKAYQVLVLEEFKERMNKKMQNKLGYALNLNTFTPEPIFEGTEK